MSLGETIRKIRTDKGVTQQHINRKLDKYPAWLCNVENNAVEISAVDLKNLSGVLDVPMDDFFVSENSTHSEKESK